MSEAPGPLNFTMFLTLFGEKLTGESSACVVGSTLGCNNTPLGCKARHRHLMCIAVYCFLALVYKRTGTQIRSAQRHAKESWHAM